MTMAVGEAGEIEAIKLQLSPAGAAVLRQALAEYQRYPTDPVAFGLAGEMLAQLERAPCARP